MSIAEIAADQNPWWRESGAHRHGGLKRRTLQPVVLQRIGDLENRRAVVVIGPRQVGKTVLLQQTAGDLIDHGWPARNITYFDFSDDRLPREKISPRDVTAIDPPGASPAHPRVFLLDEIGKSRNWDAWLKQAVDVEKDRFVATDSAATLLREGGRESGQGRWDERVLEPLSFRESLYLQGIDPEKGLGMAQDPFEAYVRRSGFPEHLLEDDYPEIRRRLREDIIDRAIRRDLLRFKIDLEKAVKLFIHLVQISGSVFSANNLAEDLKVDKRSVSDWLDLFEDTMLIRRLPEFMSEAKNARPRLRSSPKVYACDHGLIAAFSTSPDPLRDARGKMYETMVFRQLREEAQSPDALDARVFYYRVDDDLEADFVFERPSVRVVMEVTSSPDFGKKLRTLREAGKRLSARRMVLIHGGMAREKKAGVEIVPVVDFLLNPKSFLVEEEPK